MSSEVDVRLYREGDEERILELKKRIESADRAMQNLIDFLQRSEEKD